MFALLSCWKSTRADHRYSATFTETGGVGLSLNCYGLFGGTQCETVTQVNVPVSFLEQDGPA